MFPFIKTLACVLLALLIASASAIAAPAEITSPNGKVKASFEIEDGTMYYGISQNGNLIVDRSKLEIIAGAKVVLLNEEIREHDDTWSPVYGQFSEIRDHHRELELAITVDGIPMTCLCRVFDDGVGIRFVASQESAGKKLTFDSEYKLLNGVTHYTGERGRPCNWSGAQGQASRVVVPLVSVLADGQHIALLESDLYTADPFKVMRMKPNAETKILMASSSAVSQGAGHVTPWRVILIGKSAGDLVINTVPLNLAAECKIKDTSWIKPGKGLWDWRIHGYNNGSFVYGIDTRSYLHMIDFCAEQGIEYLTIDDHWFTSAGDGKMVVSPDVDIEKVMSYAKEKGVLIFLYYDRKKGNFGDESLFSHYASLGARGMKYGFMGNRPDFTRAAIDAAAENKLLINFHDGPVPMIGVERTMPNLISREFCHGQQDSRSAFTPKTFLLMSMVSSLSGPLDMSNGNFGINSINAGERKKGPKKKNSYVTTVVSEVARNVVIFSGLVTLPDAPEEYLKKSDLFAFLKEMPATWDQTLIPHSKIGQYITVARRSGDVWFVGSVNDESQRELSIKLDFLKPETDYEVTLFEDAPETDGKKNPEAYAISKKSVKQGDVISVKMALGGGHAMIIRPVE